MLSWSTAIAVLVLVVGVFVVSGFVVPVSVVPVHAAADGTTKTTSAVRTVITRFTGKT
jgi:hypothetical protein